ncbi:hypothetical protein V8G54_007282 [Vigna mungo]|uniref:Uncharacterized protein n=1 Tax=Vigna mungo TaxID=3915 RepID=A0AAQ3P303_VIGMU
MRIYTCICLKAFLTISPTNKFPIMHLYRIIIIDNKCNFGRMKMKQRFHRIKHRQFRGKKNKAYLEGELSVSSPHLSESSTASLCQAVLNPVQQTNSQHRTKISHTINIKNHIQFHDYR